MTTRSKRDSPALQKPNDAIYAAIENAAHVVERADQVRPTIVAGCVTDSAPPAQMKKSL